VSEFFFVADFSAFTDQDLGVRRNFDASQFSDFGRWLTYDCRVQGTVDQQNFTNFVSFIFIQDVAAVRSETFFYCVVY
jgi:hypothetical protein